MLQLKAKSELKVLITGLALFFCLLASKSPCFAMANRPKQQAQQPQETTIQGKVTNSSTKAPLSNATVRIATFKGEETALTTTDSVGNFTIKAKLSGYYSVQAGLTGYEPATSLRFFALGKTHTVNLSLKPIIKNYAPIITTMLPKNKSTLETGDNLNIQVNASDQNKDPLLYKYTLDGKVIRDWNSSSKYGLKTSASQRGRHKIKVEVKDNHGGSDSKTTDIYIFRAFPKPGK